jgi:hypothetical protein
MDITFCHQTGYPSNSPCWFVFLGIFQTPKNLLKIHFKKQETREKYKPEIKREI